MNVTKPEIEKTSVEQWQSRQRQRLYVWRGVRIVIVLLLMLLASLTYTSSASMREDVWYFQGVTKEGEVILYHPAHGEQQVGLCGLKLLENKTDRWAVEFKGQQVTIKPQMQYDGKWLVYLYSQQGELINEKLLVDGEAAIDDRYVHQLSGWFGKLALKRKLKNLQ